MRQQLRALRTMHPQAASHQTKRLQDEHTHHMQSIVAAQFDSHPQAELRT